MTVFKALVLGLILSCVWTHFIVSAPGKGRQCEEVLSNTHFSCAGRNLRYVPSEIPISAEHLDFSFNNLSNLNQAVFPPLPHLHVLDLTRCHIQLITDNAFFNVRNVTTFILTGNHIKNLISHDLTMVQQLIVVETRLASLEDLHIQPMSKLQILNAGTNNIKSIRIPPYLINCSNFRVLDLHANKITVITANDTLPLRQMKSRNITLILSRNYIFQIQRGAFQNIHLQGLYLLDSFPSSTVTKSGLSGLSGLKVDKLVVGHYKDNVKIVNVEDDFMDGLCSVDFQEIYFRQKEEISNGFNLFHCMSNATKISVLQGKWNDMEIVEFQQLKELQLRSCKIHFIPTMQFSTIKSLETLIVKDNVEQTEFRSAFVDLPLLKLLDLSNNKFSVKECCGNMFNGTPQLRHLNLSYNVDLKFSPLPFLGLEHLEVLDLQHTHLNAIGQFALLVNLKSLKYLDVSYSGLIFKSHISMQGLSSLKVLIMPGNTFKGDSIHYMFSNLTNLERLDISDCGIEDLRRSSFTQLDRLRHLALSGNRLMAVDFLTNPSLVSLTQIDAGQNNIVSIPLNILSHLPLNLSAFDLSRNPIECSCSNTDLIMWAINQGEKLIHPESTLCKTPFSTYVKLIEFDIAYCRHIWEVKVLVAFGIVCLILIILAVVYKYQFYLRYGFILLRGYRNPRRQEFQYDAFVIYSSKDEAWVMEELVEKIEGGVPPIHLCLHVRDFQAGKSITSNIIDEGITGSRKVIVLVSQHFIDSDWCRFEFEVAQSWVVLERNASLIIIILEDVEEEKTKKVMGLHKHLKRNTYLKWKGNALSDVMFWNRLRSAIISGK